MLGFATSRQRFIYYLTRRKTMLMPRTIVGFSTTDIKYYTLMKAWKNGSSLEFNFRDCELYDYPAREDEVRVKQRCCACITGTDKYIMLIGEDTRYKDEYVLWEAEIALKKGCTIIAVNLNGEFCFDEQTCPHVLHDVGALFVPFSRTVIAHALEFYVRHGRGNNVYSKDIYMNLGYAL